MHLLSFSPKASFSFSERLVLSALYYRGRAGRHASHKNIVSLTDLSRNTVAKYLTELVANGFVEVVAGRPKKYMLNFFRLAAEGLLVLKMADRYAHQPRTIPLQPLKGCSPWVNAVYSVLVWAGRKRQRVDRGYVAKVTGISYGKVYEAFLELEDRGYRVPLRRSPLDREKLPIEVLVPSIEEQAIPITSSAHPIFELWMTSVPEELTGKYGWKPEIADAVVAMARRKIEIPFFFLEKVAELDAEHQANIRSGKMRFPVKSCHRLVERWLETMPFPAESFEARMVREDRQERERDRRHQEIRQGVDPTDKSTRFEDLCRAWGLETRRYEYQVEYRRWLKERQVAGNTERVTAAEEGKFLDWLRSTRKPTKKKMATTMDDQDNFGYVDFFDEGGHETRNGQKPKSTEAFLVDLTDCVLAS